MQAYVALTLGIVCAGIGGELFVRGTVELAHWARVSPGLVGATVAAFATSSPELTVSVTAALAETPQIALGDALGSNYACLLSNVRGQQSPGQAEERRQSQGLLIHHQTAVFHTLHFLREDGRELYAKHLHQLRDRYP